MRIPYLILSLAAAIGAAVPAVATNPPKPGTGKPIRVERNFLKGKRPRYTRFGKLSADAKADPTKIVSIPNWSSSFTAENQTWPYTMVGKNQQAGGTVHVANMILPVNFVFDCCSDSSGNPIILQVSADVSTKVLQSPNFGTFGYSSGTTQFGDAVQRAEFFTTMGNAWHTLLGKPKVLQPVTIEVPFEIDQNDPSFPLYGFLLQDPSGDLIGVVDVNYFAAQLNTILQLENIDVDQLPIMLSQNVVYYEDQSDPLGTCCIVGFHSAFETKVVGTKHYVQTLAVASWVDDFVFGGPPFVDVLPLSHEISEWMNDPFINNAVPVWQFPVLPAGFCQDNLETGDPIEVFDNADFPVTMPNGFTYHPQNEALLPWFARQSPATGTIGGAYSYPNTTILTQPARDCGVIGPP